MSGLLSALDELAGADLHAAHPGTLGPELLELCTARNMLDAQINRRVEVFDRHGLSEADGAPSTQSWLRGRARLTPAAAAAEVTTARGLRELPVTAAAWAAGEISAEHAGAITLLAKQTSREATQGVEAALVAVARLADPLAFATELRVWRESLRNDPTKPKNESDPVTRRELTLSRSLDGMTAVRGWLTAEAAELLRAALDPLTAPLPADDRTATQRRHDALAELARRVLSTDRVAPGHRVRPQLLALCTLDGLLDAERRLLAELGYGGLIDNPTLQRLGCDSVVSRVLLSPDGEILDLGRATRTISPAQWKALVVRDRGCVFPGCDRPVHWTEGHHLAWWTRDFGRTDLDNLALLCSYHHHLVHDGGWSLFRHPGGRWAARRPDGTELHGQTTSSGAIGNPIGRAGGLTALRSPPHTHCRE